VVKVMRRIGRNMPLIKASSTPVENIALSGKEYQL